VNRKQHICAKYRDSSHPAVKLCNKMVSTEIRKARREFENKLAANIKTDRKSFCAYAKGGGRARVTHGDFWLEVMAVYVMKDMLEMVEEYNRYFSSVFTSENLQYLPREELVFTQMFGADRDKCTYVVFTHDDILNVLKRVRPDEGSRSGRHHA